MKLYLASSWRNVYYPGILAALRTAGHDVYDFRNPPQASGFSWSEVGPDMAFSPPSPKAYREALRHPRALAGFASDFSAMQEAEGCITVLPSGRSAQCVHCKQVKGYKHNCQEKRRVEREQQREHARRTGSPRG